MQKKESNFPMLLTQNGDWIEVKEIRGNDDFQKKMVSLGIVECRVIKIVQNNGTSGLILSIGENNINLEYKDAQSIYVVPYKTFDSMKVSSCCGELTSRNKGSCGSCSGCGSH